MPTNIIYTPGSNDVPGILSILILRFSLLEKTVSEITYISLNNNSGKKLKILRKKERIKILLT